MAGIGLQITTTPDARKLARGIRSLSGKFQDYTPVWRKILPAVQRDQKQAHASRGATIGAAPWKAYSPKYAKRKKTVENLISNRRVKKGENGLLKRSLGQKLSLTKKRLVVGVKGVPYAAVHQKGGKNIPARPYIGISQKMIVRTLREMNSYVRKEMRKAGRR